MYSGRCRALSAEESAERAAVGEPFAVRLRIPDHPLRFHDMVRGEVEFAQETVSDPILVRFVGGSGLQLRGHGGRRADGDYARDPR